MRTYYKVGMDLEKLLIGDVEFMGLALKPYTLDPLKNETYSKEKAMQTEKY